MDSLDEGTGRLDEQLGVVSGRNPLMIGFNFIKIMFSFSGKITTAAQCDSFPALHFILGCGHQV